jgi:hypothetical protein
MKTFTTTDGRELRLGVVSPMAMQQIRLGLLKEFGKAGKVMKCPTYQMTTAGGDVETADYDDTCIADAPESDRAAYAIYKQNTAEFGAEENNRIGNYMLLYGLPDVGVPPADWIATQRKFGIEIPEDADELRSLYIQLALLKTPADVSGIIAELILLSMDGRPQAEIEAVRNMFRGQMERA